VVFACQQAAEKALKGLVAERTQRFPPKTHDLLILRRILADETPDTFVPVLTLLNESYVAVSYAFDLEAAMKRYPRQLAEDLIPSTTELLQWVRSRLK
jgi:HEPN domain-containing protein